MKRSALARRLAFARAWVLAARLLFFSAFMALMFTGWALGLPPMIPFRSIVAIALPLACSELICRHWFYRRDHGDHIRKPTVAFNLAWALLALIAAWELGCLLGEAGRRAGVPDPGSRLGGIVQEYSPFQNC